MPPRHGRDTPDSPARRKIHTVWPPVSTTVGSSRQGHTPGSPSGRTNRSRSLVNSLHNCPAGSRESHSSVANRIRSGRPAERPPTGSTTSVSFLWFLFSAGVSAAAIGLRDADGPPERTSARLPGESRKSSEPLLSTRFVRPGRPSLGSRTINWARWSVLAASPLLIGGVLWRLLATRHIWL